MYIVVCIQINFKTGVQIENYLRNKKKKRVFVLIFKYVHLELTFARCDEKKYRYRVVNVQNMQIINYGSSQFALFSVSN